MTWSPSLSHGSTDRFDDVITTVHGRVVSAAQRAVQRDGGGQDQLRAAAAQGRAVRAVRAGWRLMLRRSDRPRSFWSNRFLQIAPEMVEVLQSRISQRTAERMRKIPFFGAVRENKPWSKLDILVCAVLLSASPALLSRRSA